MDTVRPLSMGGQGSCGISGKAAGDFQKKYSESLNPYAIRFITLIFVVHPSSTLVASVVCTAARIPAYIPINFDQIVALSIQLRHRRHPSLRSAGADALQPPSTGTIASG